MARTDNARRCLCYTWRGPGDVVTRPTPILIKRYAGERLYDTAGARYVSLDDIRSMAHDGIPIVIQDAADGTDITDWLIARGTRH